MDTLDGTNTRRTSIQLFANLYQYILCQPISFSDLQVARVQNGANYPLMTKFLVNETLTCAIYISYLIYLVCLWDGYPPFKRSC